MQTNTSTLILRLRSRRWQNLYLAVGFALYRAWWSETMTEGTVTINYGQDHLGMDYNIFLAASLIFAALLLLILRRYDWNVLGFPFIILSSTCAMAGTAIASIPALSIPAAILCSLGFIGMTAQWAQLAITSYSKETVISFLAAFLIATTLTIIFSFLPATVSTAVFSAMPFIAAMMLQAVLHEQSKGQQVEELGDKSLSTPLAPHMNSAAHRSPYAVNKKPDKVFDHPFIKTVVLFAAFITIATTLSNFYTVSELSSWSFDARSNWNITAGLISAPISGLVIVLTIYLYVTGRSLELVFNLLVVFVALGSLLAVIPNMPLAAYFLPTACGRFCFEILLWILFLLLSVRLAKPLFFFLSGIFFHIMGLLVGHLLRWLLAWVIDPYLDDPYLYIIVSVLVVAIMLLTYIFVFSNQAFRDSLRKGGERMYGVSAITQDSPDTVEQRLVELAYQYHLSEREAQVFMLLAKGRDNPYIQKSLHLAQGTVSTYKKRIYQKLDIHKAQQLIDIVEQRR